MRLRSRFPSLPVIFMSGYLGDEAAHRDVLIPGSAFLVKPFAPDILAAKVRSLLDT